MADVNTGPETALVGFAFAEVEAVGAKARSACRTRRLTVSSFADASARSVLARSLGTRIVRTSSLFGAGWRDRCVGMVV